MQVELLTQELHATETDKGLEVKRLESQLEDARQQLHNYEKIEKELDDIVMQSAQSKWWVGRAWQHPSVFLSTVEHTCDAERVLFSYGFGTSVPTHSKRRLQQR